MKKLVVLGASGSIGSQALELIKEHKDDFILEKISIGRNINKLRQILTEFPSIKEVALLDSPELPNLKTDYPNISFYIDNQGILTLLEDSNYDIVLNAIVGFAGLEASIKTIQLNKVLALANKETMVVAGSYINQLLLEHPKASIIPVDSEHSAIFQCMKNGHKNEVDKILLTASGGSFRDKSLEELKEVTLEQALNHPNWSMGASITIDSATMLNKGLEVIEAHYLFNVAYDDITVLIHRQSIIHSMVSFKDSSIIGLLSNPNMKQPISYAFNYPDRKDFKDSQIDFNQLITLTLEPVDYTRFKGLKLSFDAGRKGGYYPCVLNASKEVATNAFLNNEIQFLDIVELVEQALNNHQDKEGFCLETLKQVDQDTRNYVTHLIQRGN